MNPHDGRAAPGDAPGRSTPLDELVEHICREAIRVPGSVGGVVDALVDRRLPLATDDERSVVATRVVARLDGLDALEVWLADPDVDEVMVNRGREVWVDRGGSVSMVGELPPSSIDVVLERVLAPTGKRLDRTVPIIDARLPGDLRLCAVVAPVAVDGTTVSIRRHRGRRVRLDRFAAPAVVDLLRSIVDSRCNLLVTGATSAGKTTLLGALVAEADPCERLVLIEDTCEIAVDGHHAVRLEARSGGHDTVRPVELVDLVRAALRLRPDRLVVGEFRGDEVLAVVQALNTGHDGSFSTCHANSAIDGLRRLETLVMQASPTWPLAAIRHQVSRSVDVVVHISRDRSGRRRVAEVVEVVESDGPPTGRALVDAERVVGTLGRGRR